MRETSRTWSLGELWRWDLTMSWTLFTTRTNFSSMLLVVHTLLSSIQVSPSHQSQPKRVKFWRITYWNSWPTHLRTNNHLPIPGLTAHRPNAEDDFNFGVVLTSRPMKSNEVFEVRQELTNHSSELFKIDQSLLRCLNNWPITAQNW